MWRCYLMLKVGTQCGLCTCKTHLVTQHLIPQHFNPFCGETEKWEWTWPQLRENIVALNTQHTHKLVFKKWVAPKAVPLLWKVLQLNKKVQKEELSKVPGGHIGRPCNRLQQLWRLYLDPAVLDSLHICIRDQLKQCEGHSIHLDSNLI